MDLPEMNYLDDILWNSDGLAPAIAQDAETGDYSYGCLDES